MLRKGGIGRRIVAVGAMPVLVAATIAVVAWFLLREADHAHSSAVTAGVIYRELVEASSARADYLHAAGTRRAAAANRFDGHTDEARRQLDALEAVVAGGEYGEAVTETRWVLDRYAAQMEEFKAVTEHNDALIAAMARQAAMLVDITDGARRRQHIANTRYSETVVGFDKRLRALRHVLDGARSVYAALAGLWRREAGRLAGTAVAADEAGQETAGLMSRLSVATRTLEEALDHAANYDGVRLNEKLTETTQFIGRALAARGDMAESAAALERGLDRIMNVYGTAYASALNEVTELSAHAVTANETEQQVQGAAIAALSLTGRASEAVGRRDAAASAALLEEGVALEKEIAKLPLSPLAHEDMMAAVAGWRESFERTRQGLARQDIMIAAMDADSEAMAAAARMLDDVFRVRADNIGAYLRTALAAGASIGLLLAVIGAYFAARSIIRPIDRLRRQMTHLANNPLTGEIVDVHRRDELGAMARAVRLFVTEIASRETALREAKNQAEEATRAKSSFLAVMSHEIRTPMNGVMAMAEMMEQTDLTEEQHGMLGVIRSSAQALLIVINDILDFSKIEAGKLEIEAVPFGLTDVVEEAAELTAGRAEEKGLGLSVVIAPDVPERLTGDPSRLRQVLINLIGNAVKFTEKGGVTVTVATLPGVEGALRFAVTDTGIGMTEQQRGRLFQAFQQADSSTSRRFGGTGLGLTICRRLCELMGGEIGVDSAYGEGSTFWFELPFTAPEEAGGAFCPARPDVQVADARVLAVGFDAAGKQALAAILTAAGAPSAVYCDYAGAVAMAGDGAAAPVAVVVAAGGDAEPALRCCRALRAAHGDAVKVILAAPRSLASTMREADRIGLLCTLNLPLRRRRLWLALAAALGRASLDRRSGRRDPNAAGWAAPPIEEAAAAGALILVAEDNPINRTVIGRMLAGRGYAFEMAEDGAKALAMFDPGRYGLLLTDFHMPEMDGFVLTQSIRAMEDALTAAGMETPRLPIVALTADAMLGAKQRCMEAGMDGFLTKPIEAAALTETLDRWLPDAKALRRPAAQAVAPAVVSTAMAAVETAPAPSTVVNWAESDVDPQIFDVGQLLQNFSPDDPEAMAFLEQFLAMAPPLIAAAEAGLAVGEPGAARDAVHTLKGAALSIGAVRLGRLAADAQDALDEQDLDTAGLLTGMLAPTFDELEAATAPMRAAPALTPTS